MKSASIMLVSLLSALPGCTVNASGNCGADKDPSRVTLTAHVGTMQSDGSVVVYGTVSSDVPNDWTDSHKGSSEITARAVYVAGLEARPATDDFNSRSWTVTLPADRLTAYADGTGTAQLPVVVYLYGGCIKELEADQRPTVRVAVGAAGVGGTGGSTALAGSGGAS